MNYWIATLLWAIVLFLIPKSPLPNPTQYAAATSVENATQPESSTSDRVPNLQLTSDAPTPPSLEENNKFSSKVLQLPEQDIFDAHLMRYLSNLSSKGYDLSGQGVWIDDGNLVLANAQGTTPLSAASLTKIATTLAVLEKRGFSRQLVKTIARMNDVSDNATAESLAQSVGGVKEVERITRDLTRLDEITLYTGSGLPSVAAGKRVENMISPRAVCSMFRILSSKAQQQGLALKDLFPSVGQGTLTYRSLPQGTVGKTGTLKDASALAGVVPLGSKSICFAIINQGSAATWLKQQQDNLVKSLM